MSKSTGTEAGLIYLTDEPAAIMKKFKRAVTDSDNEVRFDREAKPGVSNLLEINSAVTGRPVAEIAEHYVQYGALKVDTGEAVVEALRPIQQRYQELRTDPGELARLLRTGAQKARDVAGRTLERAHGRIGLLPPHE